MGSEIRGRRYNKKELLFLPLYLNAYFPHSLSLSLPLFLSLTLPQTLSLFIHLSVSILVSNYLFPSISENITSCLFLSSSSFLSLSDLATWWFHPLKTGPSNFGIPYQVCTISTCFNRVVVMISQSRDVFFLFMLFLL